MTEASAPPSNRAIPAVTSLNDLRSYRSLGRELTGQSERMLTATGFGDAIRDVGPETQAIYAEHLSDNEGELLHPLVSNVREFAITAFDAHDDDLLNRILGVMVLGLEQGDERVRNAVEVSFVEDSCWYPQR